MTALVVGVVGTVLAAVFLIPQIVRLATHRDVNGVSPTWAVFGVVTNSAWVVYLVGERLWIAAIAPALAVISYGMLIALISRVSFAPRWVWSGFVYALALVLVTVFGGVPVLGTILAITPVVQLTPEIVTVYRHPRPSGVSPLTWGLGAGEAFCWGVYGLMMADASLFGYGVVTSIGSGLILGRWWATREPSQDSSRSVTSTRPSRIALAAASPRLPTPSLRRMFET